MIRRITSIDTLDFQIERFTGELEKRYEEVKQDKQDMAVQIYDMETWYDWWFNKAISYQIANKLELAMIYFRAALFYLAQNDPRKEIVYQKYRQVFEDYYCETDLQYHSISYRNGELPAVFIPKKDAKRTLVIVGGFDSYMEELVSWFLPIQETIDYNLVLFDGPGQGSTVFQGMVFQADYEQAISTVLDYFQLTDVALLGVSWGGYFTLRAAAFDRRIKQCIAFDIFYDAMDALKLQTNRLEYMGLRLALALRQKRLINSIFQNRTQSDMNLAWILRHGLSITGKDTAYDFIKHMQKHRIKECLELIQQDCLLLAGTEDHYVPYTRLEDIKKGLVNARSVEAKLFTRETGGVLHCQIDAIDLAMKEIVNFLRTY